MICCLSANRGAERKRGGQTDRRFVLSCRMVPPPKYSSVFAGRPEGYFGSAVPLDLPQRALEKSIAINRRGINHNT